MTTFKALVDKRRRDQQSGTILRTMPQSQPREADLTAFRTRCAPHNLCILPDGVDGLEIANVRWSSGGPEEQEADSSPALCTASSSRVTLLAAAAHQQHEAAGDAPLLELSSGPLLIDGLDRHAEILIQLKDTCPNSSSSCPSSSSSSNDLFRYGQYHVFSNASTEQDKQRDFAVKLSETLFGGDGNAPVLMHANPCPLTFDRYCQLAVSNKYKPAHPNCLDLKQQQLEQQQTSASAPVTSFVRKLAAASVVICRVPKTRGKIYVGSKDNNNTGTNTNNSDNDNDNAPSSYDHFVLLTQRQSYMRTFPGFFVVPGGGFDAHDGTLENCAKRELMEEVSLQFCIDQQTQHEQAHSTDEQARQDAASSPTSSSLSSRSRSSNESSGIATTIADGGEWHFEGIWESSFCTHPDDASVADGSCAVRGHVVFFFSVVIDARTAEELPRLKAQSEEVASAKWYRCGPDVDGLAENLMVMTMATKSCKSRDDKEHDDEDVGETAESRPFIDFGSVPPITEYFEKMELDPQRIELTLQLEDEIYGSKSKKKSPSAETGPDVSVSVADSSSVNSNLGKRMKITAGTEYFIKRALERMILKERRAGD